ncbi:scm-like with four MBT domains protein 1 [Rhincodon typus]|uniref:scm-like with four MBT domains protein 1 n=1 Tax=Rhincodon typus TaxID=259920 RepID=UPI00202F570B|nr:scm-like with four MBT domains protein 1 [Rhincodon typus]
MTKRLLWATPGVCFKVVLFIYYATFLLDIKPFEWYELNQRKWFECFKQTLLALEPESRKASLLSMQESTTLFLEKTQSPNNLNGEQYDSDVGSGGEDLDFNWDDYLEETGASPAPHNSFKHVEISLQSSFQPGMKLEVANKNNPDTYWVATIITTCGQLLLLRYSGYGDDRRADFWCDVMTADLHPVGWCSQNKKALRPPEGRIYEFYAIIRNH